MGDVRYGSVKRVASGVGEGSVAIQFVHQYLSNVSTTLNSSAQAECWRQIEIDFQISATIS